MASLDLTNYTLIRNEAVIVTALAANTVTPLLITPTVGMNKVILILMDTSADDDVTVDIAAGDFWAGKAITQITLLQNVPRAFCFESAKVMSWEANTAATANAYRIKVTIGNANATTVYQVIQLP